MENVWMVYAVPRSADETGMVAHVQFQEIAHPQQSSPAATAEAPAPVDNRRRSTRFPTATIGRLTSLADPNDAQEIYVTDVSLHGTGFKCTAPLRGDGRYRIEIGNGPLHLSATLRVVSCRPRRDNTYDAGGEFV